LIGYLLYLRYLFCNEMGDILLWPSDLDIGGSINGFHSALPMVFPADARAFARGLERELKASGRLRKNIVIVVSGESVEQSRS
jgi:hypothetical protein